MPNRGRASALLPVVFAVGLFGWAAWPWLPFSHGATPPRTIVFYGFSILGEVFNDAIFPAFEAKWRAQHGEEIKVLGSFASSGTITNQVILGVPADLVLVSLELDALRLAEAGVVRSASWRTLPHAGVVNRTPFVILVRPGNPKRISGFEDLARPAVGVVHPDPLTSGGANWALVAEYGAGTREHPDRPDAGFELLRGVWKNVVAQASSARAARTQFETGFGDALVTYEQEALWDRARGKLRADVVYPRRTVLSEHTLVIVDRNVTANERPIVEGLTRFLWSDEAQRLFVRYGFRSVMDEWNADNPGFGRVEDPFTIEAFGGWKRAKRDIVDGVWKARVLPELQ
jgi:sulfate/thiosulfate-binding protein